jgi:hypothetical protein
MSDGGRGRASLGVKVWKSSQKWSVQRSAVRSIVWLDGRVPYNLRGALRSISVEWKEKAQPKRKNREQKCSNPRRNHANRSGSQQEEISEEDDNYG